MELGATVCTPANPRCPACPLIQGCAAVDAGDPGAFPLPRPKRRRENHRWVVVWLERDDGRVLLRRVDDGPLLVGLWLPPFKALVPDGAPETAARTLAREAGVAVALVPCAWVRHAITHRDIQVLPFAGPVVQPRAAESRDGWSWQDPARPSVASSTLLRKVAAVCPQRASMLPFPNGLEECT